MGCGVEGVGWRVEGAGCRVWDDPREDGIMVVALMNAIVSPTSITFVRS